MFPRSALRAVLVALLASAIALTGAVRAGDSAGSEPGARWSSGVGREAALANPSCDPETGRLRYASRYRPPCVVGWTLGAANGGATAQGVTAATIKVAVLVPVDGLLAPIGFPQALPLNQATREVGTFADAARDASSVFDHAGFETWGRQLEFTFVISTGVDEAAQIADAAAVIAQQPFAAVVPAPATSGIGGAVFERSLADANILVVGYPTTKEAIEQAPYRWSAAAGDDRARVQLTAEFAGRQLAGRRASSAGTSELRAARRVFGVVYPTGPTGIEGERFRRVVRASGPTTPVRVVDVAFDPTLATSDPVRFYQDLVPGFVARLRDAGVTTVVPFTDATVMNALMKAATNLGYAPEWISTPGSTNGGLPNLRGLDQDQASRFFGLQSATVPALSPAATQPLQGFQWYWGTSRGTSMGSITAAVELLRTGVHLAGPRLSASRFSEGMCAMGAIGGAADGTQSSMRAPCRSSGLPWYVHHAGSIDGSLGWWDPNATFTTSTGQTVGLGAWRFIDQGRRHRSGTFPHSEKSYFAHHQSTLAFDTPRTRDLPLAYPCIGCPGGDLSALPVSGLSTPSAATQAGTAAASGAALPEDFPDPFVLRVGDDFYGYSTGGSRGIVQAAHSRDLVHWTWLGSALAAMPRWSTGRAIWAPSVARLGLGYVMYFAARDRASGQWCLSYATAPAPNSLFVDSTSAPIVCDADRGGSIDPEVFVDRDGTPYLLWKTNAAPGSATSVLVGARLTGDGRGLTGPIRTLLASSGGWDGAIIENPSMTFGSDGYTLLYSGNSFDTDRYAVGTARCEGPLGPCTRVSDGPALASAGPVLGPGGASVVTGPDGVRSLVFAAWTAPRVGYQAGGARSLYVRPLTSIGLAPRSDAP